MKTCDMPTGPESKRCGRVAVTAFVWTCPDWAGDKRDACACAEHAVPMGDVLEWNEGRRREARELPPPSDADVLRHVLSR